MIVNRRQLGVLGPAIAAFFGVRSALAQAVIGGGGPVESLKLDRRARVLKRQSVAVPPAGRGSTLGIAGADIVAPARGYIGVDWALQDSVELGVLIVTEQQKAQLVAGRQPSQDPLLRVDVDGPETAGQTVIVDRGNYYVAFLNRTARPITFVYRTTFLPF